MKKQELPKEIEEELDGSIPQETGEVSLRSLNNLRIHSLLVCLSKASIMADDNLRFNILNELMTEHLRSKIDKKHITKIDEKMKTIINYFKAKDRDLQTVIIKKDKKDKIIFRKDLMFEVWNLLNETTTILKQALYDSRMT